MSNKYELDMINQHGVAVESEIIVRTDCTWDARVNFGGGWRTVGFGMEPTEARAKAAAESARDVAIARQRVRTN